MAAFVSRAVTNTMIPAISWKRLKAPKMARFCIRLFTVTTHRASLEVARALPRPAHLLLLRLEESAPNKRSHSENRQMLSIALSDQSYGGLVVGLPQSVKKTTKR